MASGMLNASNTIKPGKTQKAMLANPPVRKTSPAMNSPSNNPSVKTSH